MKRLLAASVLAAGAAWAGDPPVVIRGAVPDVATRAAVLARAQALYGAGRVADQMTVGAAGVPPGWPAAVQKLLPDEIRFVIHGQLKVEGRTVSIQGEVANDVQHRQLIARLTEALDGSFTLRDGLRSGAPEQAVLDAALADRIIEFETGKAALTPSGQAILDQMAEALRKVGGKRVEVIGHTDNAGSRSANLGLSLARAEAVRSYLAGKGIAPDRVAVAGAGPDRPVADNATADGRARNRRIEFRVLP
ncbi:MAG TPA: OmpA family protein [Telluria sp.]|nr:OmpA family protein [Telluria sp.]